MIYIFLALIFDYFAADPYWFPHPVKIMGKYINLYEKNIRCIVKSDFGLKLVGLFLALTLTVISYLVTFVIIKIAFKINFYFGSIINIILLWNCIALRCLDKEIMKIYMSLKCGNIDLARNQISYLVSRDTEHIDENGIIKATVETAVENTSDGIIAPLIYMIIGGAPLAMAYKAINTMDSMVGYKNFEYFNFGYFPAKIDDIVNFIPARFTGFAMVIWAFLTGDDYKKGYEIMLRDSGKSKSPNAGWPESAAAGILGIEICGPSYYFGEIVEKETIGDKINEINFENIKTSCGLMYGVVIIVFIVGVLMKSFL